MPAFSNTITCLNRFLGLEANKSSHMEKWISATGGLFGILAVTLISQQFLDLEASTWVVASMGATAVLVFAVPHGPLSQPWAVLGGHVISASIGVACVRWIPFPLLASAMAVALAIGSMYYLRCIHPPGGATALTAVIGGPGIQVLGFEYVITPVLLNAITMVLIAILFNYAFRWRRYPSALASGNLKTAVKPGTDNTQKSLSKDDIDMALQVMNSTLNISSQDLTKIYRLARDNKLTEQLSISRF